MAFRKWLVRYLVLFVVLMLLFTLLLTAAFALPTPRMQSNIQSSIPLLEKEGLYPRPLLNSAQTQLDNYTDALALGLAGYAGAGHPLEKALRGTRIHSPDGPIDALAALTEGDMQRAGGTAYGADLVKYWNGCLTFLKPLLLLFGYREVRVLCFHTLFLLFALLLMCVARRLGLAAGLAVAAALVCVRFFVVPATITMAPGWFVALAAGILVLRLRGFGVGKCSLLFFAVGCVANYFDYMLTPLLTLGFPLVLLFMCLWREQPAAGLGSLAATGAGAGVAWVGGFALTWAFKWALSSLFIGENVFKTALESILWRTESLEDKSRLYGVQANYGMLFTKHFKKPYVIIGLLLVLVILWLLLRKKGRPAWRYLLAMAAIAALPVVWYIALANHSGIHAAFTYRYTAITLLAAAFVYLQLLDLHKLKRGLAAAGGWLRARLPGGP